MSLNISETRDETTNLIVEYISNGIIKDAQEELESTQ